MKTDVGRTLRETHDRMKDLREQGYECYLFGKGNGEVGIHIECLSFNNKKGVENERP